MLNMITLFLTHPLESRGFLPDSPVAESDLAASGTPPPAAAPVTGAGGMEGRYKSAQEAYEAGHGDRQRKLPKEIN